MRTALAGVLFLAAATAAWAAEEPRLAKGDYAIRLTADGLEATWKGTPFLCASHFSIAKPEWKGNYYSGDGLLNRATATVGVSADAITVTDTAPAIGGQVTHGYRLDDEGLTVTLTLSIVADIAAGPTEYTGGILPGETFAGGRYRALGVLGQEDWRALPAEKPTQTGPGTLHLCGNLNGLDVAGHGIVVHAEAVEGPALQFYDMRSRGFAGKQSNYWLLYSFPAGKGETRIATRFTVEPDGVATPAPAGGPVVLTEGGTATPVTSIVVDPAAHAVEKAAARELQAYLVRLGGNEIPIVESDGTAPVNPGTLLVGPGKAAGALYQASDLDPLGPDGFILRAKDGRLAAVGKNHRGTVYAVYRLLERLGCRFYARELEVVPPGTGVNITAPFHVADSAGFEWRAMMGTIPTMKCSLSPGEWEANVAGEELPKMMAFPKGGFWHHTMGFLLPAKPLADTHPEYLALIGKDRKVSEPAVQQYCLSNPELLQTMTGKVMDWIASDPDKLYYPVHYGDVVKFCECDACKALYEEKGSVTDTVIWFDNQIAKAVAAKYPGKFVTILAYHSTRTPPKNVKPEPNLLIIFCAIVECQARPWSHPVNMNLNVCRDLEDWVRLHPLGPQGIMTFDYPATYHYAGYTYPALYAFVDNIRYYRKLGLRGVYVCGLGRWKHLEHVYSYVIPRIMWNPDQDMGGLIDEFCNAWYGPAAKPMRAYVELLHRSAMESTCDGVADCHKGPGQKFFRDLYTPEFVTQAYALFAQAETQATDPLVRNRVAKDKWGFLVTDLFLNGTKSGEILPASNDAGLETKLPSLDEYRKVSELLRINRLFNRPWLVNAHQWNRFSLGTLVGFEPEREPWWTAPRVRDVMANPDAAFQKAQDLDRAKKERFVTLENAELQAIVVPALGGRIWRLYHKGLKSELLRRAPLPIGGLEQGLPPEPYVRLSGYEEYTAKKFGSIGWGQAFHGQRAADGNSITLTATFANGLKLTRMIALAPDKPELTIDSKLENTGTQPVKDAVLRVHPEFLPQPGDEKPELQIRTAAGVWTTIPYEAGDNFLTGDKRPQGAWALRFPKTGLRIANELDPAQIETWYFYNGATFFNLELFSPVRELAPGASLSLKHRYVVSRGE